MSFLERQPEDPARFARLKRLFYVGLALVALAEIVLPLVLGGGHPHFSFESFPAWGSLYGLISCVAIIATRLTRPLRNGRSQAPSISSSPGCTQPTLTAPLPQSS